LDGKERAPWETHALELTVNKHMIDRAKGVIVHSDMAKQMVKGIRPEVPVINIPLHTPDIQDNYLEEKSQAKRKLKHSENTLILGSFGYATRAKRILETLEALAMYYKNNSKDFHYYIVGKVDDIDVEGKIKELSLEGNVTVTGFTEIEDFKTYMNACDICFNLRYPTHGESSASLHRMLGMGKPVIVSQIGSFEEYPDDIVIKVSYDEKEIIDIYSALCDLTKNTDTMIERSKRANEFAQINCSLSVNARRYYEFFTSVSHHTFSENGIDAFIDRLFELNLINDDYVEHLIKDKLID
jgi:glycosyltransferase involved in cell wall biosynthesis